MARGDGVVALGRGLDAVGLRAEVDRVEVAVKDLILGELAGELARVDDFVHLALDRVDRGRGTLLQFKDVLHVLLGDRRASLDWSALEVGEQCANHASRVDAVVGEKGSVL